MVVLGATGSIGDAAADVLAEGADRFRVIGLAAGRRGEALLKRGRRLGARVIALVDEEAAEALRPHLVPGDPELRAGREGLLSLLAEDGVGIVVQGTSGAAGLEASLDEMVSFDKVR